MRAITIYECSDGSRWDTTTKAVARDGMISECEDAESTTIGKVPMLHSIDATENYYQHDVAVVAKAKQLWEMLAMKYFGTLNGRVIGDSNNPVSSMMYRLRCIDNTGREWQQPYFGNHPPINGRCINTKEQHDQD